MWSCVNCLCLCTCFLLLKRRPAKSEAVSQCFCKDIYEANMTRPIWQSLEVMEVIKEEKQTQSSSCVCVCVSWGGAQHEVRYTRVVKRSISSYDLWCVPPPLSRSLVCVTASLYCELLMKQNITFHKLVLYEGRWYFQILIRQRGGWWWSITYIVFVTFNFLSPPLQTQKKTIQIHTPQLLSYSCGATCQWHWAQTSWD